MENQNTRKIIYEQIFVTIVFLIFYVYLIMQFSKVFIYYDDYGYLSLSYGNIVSGVEGDKYNIKQLIQFLIGNYKEANGRLFPVFVYLLTYMLGGLKLVQLFMATIMLGISILSYSLAINWKTSTERKILQKSIVAIFICVLYGSVGVAIHRLGTYWFAASFMYVLPTFSFMLFALFYEKSLRSEKALYKIICVVMAYVTAFSQEQWVVAIVGYLLCRNMMVKVITKEKKIGTWNLAVVFGTIIGAIPIFTSPAAYARMESNATFAEKSLLERILDNIVQIVKIFFTKDNKLYIHIFLVMAFILAIYVLKEKHGNKYINRLYTIVSILMIILYSIRTDYQGVVYEYNIWIIYIYFVYILFMTYEVCIFLFIEEEYCKLSIYIAAFLSVACLIIVPELPLRVLIPYILLSFGIFGFIIIKAFDSEIKIWIMFSLILFWAKDAFFNVKSIYVGYEKNYLIHQYNDKKIREAANQIKLGNMIDNIELFQELDIVYGSEMVYVENFEFMKRFMEEYYNIPASVNLKYEQLDDINKLEY